MTQKNNNEENINQNLEKEENTDTVNSDLVENSDDSKKEQTDPDQSENVNDENNDSSNSHDNQLNENTKFWTKKKIIAMAVTVLLLVPGLAVGSSYALSRINSGNEAQSALDKIAQQKDDLRVVNTKLETYKGQKIESANIEQKSLTTASGEGADSAVFLFSNGKSSESKKTVDVYLDFSSQKSRDFILLNQSSLKNMIENNIIDLKIHPVPSSSAFSVYAAEAVSESIVTSPNQTWDFIIELLKTSSTLKTDKNDDIVKAVLKAAKDQGVRDIDADSIKNGTFASWILAVGDDKNLQTGYYPPIIYVNDKIVNPDKVSFTDSSAFQKYILNEERN